MHIKSKRAISRLLVAVMLLTPAFNNINGIQAFATTDTSNSRKIDVWDFGGVQTATSPTSGTINNIISRDVLDKLTTVKAGLFQGTTTFGDLLMSPVAAVDRLYYYVGDSVTDTTKGSNSYGTGNNSINVYNDGYTSKGMIYCNAPGGNTQRYLTIANVVAGDKISVYGGTNNGNETIHFVHAAVSVVTTTGAVTVTPDVSQVQDSTVAFTTTAQKVDFVAQYSGSYQIYVTANKGKPFFNRVDRTPGVKVSGKANLNGNVISNYSLNFVNQTSKEITAVSVNSDNTFNAVLGAGCNYTVLLNYVNNHYTITDETKVVSTSTSDIVAGLNNVSLDIGINKIDTISGNIKGFGSGYDLSKLQIKLTPPTGSLSPEVSAIVDTTNMTFTAVIQQGVQYTVVISGANDYEITDGGSVNISIGTELYITIPQDITVAQKSVYVATGKFLGLSPTGQIQSISFTNVDDSYTYVGTVVDGGYTVSLRNGAYSVKAVCTEKYDTSYHVVVNGQNTIKDILFNKVSSWNLVNVTSQDIAAGSYKGLTLSTVTTTASFGVNGNALSAKSGCSIIIPVVAGQMVTASGWNSGQIYFSEAPTNILTIKSTDTAAAPAKLSYTVVTTGTVTLNVTGTATAYLTAIDCVQQLSRVADLYVGDSTKQYNYSTVKEALDVVARMNPTSEAQRITVHIAPGVYRAQLKIATPYITLVNSDPSKQVKITWYYGFGYQYYSVGSDGFYNSDRSTDKYLKNHVSDGKWGGSVYLTSAATAFKAENIVFENSFNKYVTSEELADGVEICNNFPQSVSGTLTARTATTDVTTKVNTERASAIIIEADNVEFNKCSFIGSQDTLYTGGLGTYNQYYKNCFIEGNTDYIFGDGNAVFDNSTLNFCGYSDAATAGYITAAKDTATYGYLFNGCTVTANSNNMQTSGYFGRPWSQGAKVKYLNTKLQSASIISPQGWFDMSGATPEKANFAEYNTTYNGVKVDTTARRATVLSDTTSIASINSYFGDWSPIYYTTPAAITVITSISTPAAITVAKGNAVTLPTTLTAVYSDGTTSSAAITWNGTVDVNTVGQQVITGTVVGYSNTVSITINVISSIIVPIITSITTLAAITVENGNSVTLPTTVIAVYSDGSQNAVAVTWKGTVDVNTVGQQVIQGTVSGYNGIVTVTVNVIPPVPDPKDYTVTSSFNLSSLQAGKMLEAQTSITNNNSTIGSVLAIVALYDGSDKMVNAAYMTKDISIGKTEKLIAGFKLPSNITNYKVRVFVWDGTNISTSKMQPLSNVVTLK